jgi:hypothetical protein
MQWTSEKKGVPFKLESPVLCNSRLGCSYKKSTFFTYGNHQIYSKEPDPESYLLRLLPFAVTESCMRFGKLFSTSRK